MKAKNIFKTLAFAMMPAMLLTTACSNNDDALINSESTAQIGYTLPITVDVTRQGDNASTRATYNESTKKLDFSEGDKLLLRGSHSSAGKFAGTLDRVSGGKFSGNITIEKSFSGTAQELLTAATYIFATLLPNGYETYGYVSIDGSGCNQKEKYIEKNAFATSKVVAVEQFSCEWVYVEGNYSGSIRLGPHMAILNFTINDLTPNATVTATLTKGSLVISGDVKTDGSGTATFAVAVDAFAANINNFTLTVGGKAITLGSHTLANGYIYNINRGMRLSSASTADYGKVVCNNGHMHDAKTAVPAGCTAVGVLGKVTSAGHGLILALKDATEQTWNTINSWGSVTTYASTTLKVLPDDAARGTNLTSYTELGNTTVSNWAVAQKSDYEAIFTNLGSVEGNDDGLTCDANVEAYIKGDVGGAGFFGSYWTASQRSSGGEGWAFSEGHWFLGINEKSQRVRPILAF